MASAGIGIGSSYVVAGGGVASPDPLALQSLPANSPGPNPKYTAIVPQSGVGALVEADGTTILRPAPTTPNILGTQS
jgi:hypothetical protein